MSALYSLVAVLLLSLIAVTGVQFGPARFALVIIVPYAAFATFLVGSCYRVLQWASVPVPFRIPTTCGQQKSLPWIKQAKADNPSTGWGVLARMAAEVLLFRSLFRNSCARVSSTKITFGENKYLWLAALSFHWSLLLIVVRHLRLVLQPVPAFVNALDRLDSFFQVGTPPLYASDVMLAASITYLIIRRLRDPMVRYISLFSDYFALFLLAGIGLSGALMRYWMRVDVAGVKQFALSIAAFHPSLAIPLSSMFAVHLVLVCTLAAYFPFSKLMHAGGVFLSPTRNLANNNRAKRHINPWNYPVKTHTYAEWEQEFRDKLKAAEIPLEADDVRNVSAD
jgi:nitrate reductase gamma subunit